MPRLTRRSGLPGCARRWCCSAWRWATGAATTKLPGRCEIIQFGLGLQPVYTIVLACPRMDMIRLLPLTVQQTWFDDGWEEYNKENELVT